MHKPIAPLYKIIFILILTTVHTYATTIEVTSTDNNGIGSLRDAISSATSGDTITFSSLIEGDTIFLTTSVSISKNLTIIGDSNRSTILHGSGSTLILNIPSGRIVKLSRLKLRNGNSGQGGAIYNAGTLIMNSCSLLQNVAAKGGAIYNQFSTLIMKNCEILGNRGTLTRGGAIYGAWADLTFINCFLSGNKSDGLGGALYNEFGGENTFINSTISGNSASAGGAIYSENSTSLRNCIVAKNSATSYNNFAGGPIFQGSYNFIDDTTDVANVFDQTNLKGGSGVNALDPLFVTNVDMSSLPNSSGDLRLQCNSLALNAGTPDTTGLNLGSSDIDGNSRVINSIIDIGAYEKQTLLIVNNTSDDGSKSLRTLVKDACSGDTILFDSSINGDTIMVDSFINFGKNLNLIGNDTSNTIISGQDSTVIFTNSTGDTVSIESISITKGKAIVGGGIFNNGSLRINQCNISGNRAINRGGGLANFGELQLLNSSITKNKIIVEGSTQAEGGGIYSAGTLSVLGSVINQNYAEADGVLGGGVYSKSTIKFMNSILNSNHAAGSSFAAGGAIYAESAVDTTDIVNCLVSGNLVESSYSIGGGLFSISPTSITNSTISGNQCSSLGTGQGGGIWISGNTNIANTIVAKNNAVSDGIDIYRSSGTINDIGNNHVMAAGGNHGITSGNGIDPLFIQDVDLSIMPTLSGDLRLWCNSPAIDAGTLDTSGLNIGNIDLNSFARTVNNRIDIGAIEFFDDQLIDQLILNGTPPIEKLETAKNIDAGATVDNSTTLFRVEETVTLSENFEVGLGKEFEVVLDTCPN